MQKYYFTFGSDKQFPYGRDEFVVVTAENALQACNLFRVVHPSRKGSNFINCSEVYSEQDFEEFRDKYYHNVLPVEMITITKRDGE